MATAFSLTGIIAVRLPGGLSMEAMPLPTWVVSSTAQFLLPVTPVYLTRG